MVVKQFGWGVGVESLPLIGYVMVFRYCFRFASDTSFRFVVDFNRLTHKQQIVWVLYGQASRAISIG